MYVSLLYSVTLWIFNLIWTNILFFLTTIINIVLPTANIFINVIILTGSSQCIMRDFKCLCSLNGLLQPNVSTVCYVSVLMVLHPQDTICIHICTWPNVKRVSQTLWIWMYTHSGTFPYINSVWLLPVSYSKFVNCPIFLTQTYVRTDS